MQTINPTAWSTIEHFARYCGPAWTRIAAGHSALGYRFILSRAKPARPPYADWPAIVRFAYQSTQPHGFVDGEWLAAMCWYSTAVRVEPDYITARVSPDPRLRALAERHRHRYGDVFAPLLPWHTLEHAPIGGRWDDARWVALLSYNGGPYQPTRRL